MHIKADEHSLIRVFAADIDATQTEAFKTRDIDGNSPLQTALGAKFLHEDQTEVFDVGDLDDLGLAGYLEEGCGVSGDQIDDMRSQLAAVKGPVVIVFSTAFGRIEQTLTVQSPLRHIATFEEEPVEIKFDTLPSEAAQRQDAPAPSSTKKQPSNAAMSGRVATFALLGIALFTVLFIWIGS